MPWKQYEFKGQTVYVRVLPTGKPIVRHGRVELRYKLGARKSYRASPEGLEPVEGDMIEDSEMSGNAGAGAATAALKETPTTPADADTIVIYTDGVCSGNPGPAGVGVYFERREQTVEISEYLGSGTNNIAELSAILRGLQTLRDDERESLIHLYTDSAWSLGVLVGGWKAKTNADLIEKIRAEMATLPRLELLKVRTQTGNAGSEEADRLSNKATRREASAEPRVRRRRVS